MHRVPRNEAQYSDDMEHMDDHDRNEPAADTCGNINYGDLEDLLMDVDGDDSSDAMNSDCEDGFDRASTLSHDDSFGTSNDANAMDCGGFQDKFCDNRRQQVKRQQNHDAIVEASVKCEQGTLGAFPGEDSKSCAAKRMKMSAAGTATDTASTETATTEHDVLDMQADVPKLRYIYVQVTEATQSSIREACTVPPAAMPSMESVAASPRIPSAAAKRTRIEDCIVHGIGLEETATSNIKKFFTGYGKCGLFGRFYESSFGLQSAPNAIRQALCGSLYYDIDMASSVQRLLYSILRGENIARLTAYIKDREAFLEKTAAHYFGPSAGPEARTAVKKLYNRLTHGGSEMAWRKAYAHLMKGYAAATQGDAVATRGYPFALAYAREMKSIVIPCMKALFPKIAEQQPRDKDDTWVLAMACQSEEACVLLWIESFYEQQGYVVGTLIHDGVHVLRPEDPDTPLPTTPEVLDACAAFVKAQSARAPPAANLPQCEGYSIVLTNKPFGTPQKQIVKRAGAPPRDILEKATYRAKCTHLFPKNAVSPAGRTNVIAAGQSPIVSAQNAGTNALKVASNVRNGAMRICQAEP